MPGLKKQLPFLLLLSIVYLSYFFIHIPQPENKHKVLSANTNLVLFIQPESGHQPILDVLSSAQKEILMSIYLLSDKQIIQALIDAKQRGVRVVVMMEEHPFGGGNLNSKSAEQLKKAGIDVGWSNPDFSLTHQKSIVVDRTQAFILNQNLTAAAFSKNREYNILDTNPEDVQEIRTMFIADWERKAFTPKNPHLLISPHTARSGITQLLSKSTKSIDMEVEIISDKAVLTQLIDLAQTHTIRVLAPTITQISSNQDKLERLSAHGIQVRVLSSPYIHAKLIIIDGKEAYIGSVNLSSQSLDENRELGIVLDQEEILQTLTATFEADFAKGTPL